MWKLNVRNTLAQLAPAHQTLYSNTSQEQEVIGKKVVLHPPLFLLSLTLTPKYSSTVIKTLEARPPFPDFFYRRLYDRG